MRIFNKYCQIFLVLLALVGVMQLLVGCERRNLEEEEEIVVIAMVPFKIDWSKSGLDVSQVHRATIRVFPHDGSPAYDFRLEDNLTDAVMPLPVGTYSFVIYNETLDAEDWKSNIFKGEDRYDTFLVTSPEDDFEGLYKKAEGERLTKMPDVMASWSIDNFEVTQDMITYLHAQSQNGRTKAPFTSEVAGVVEQQLQKLVAIAPVPIVKTLHIMVRVQNLINAKKSSGAFTGATESVLMSTREVSKHRITHVFILNGRKYDNPEKPQHGTIHATIFVFNVTPYEELKCEISVDFMLHNGEKVPTEVFDITKEVTQLDVDININLGLDTDDHPDDHPIVLPEDVKVGNGEVEVDNWKEVVIPVE